jgi:predicted GNAT family acetyltransferase
MEGHNPIKITQVKDPIFREKHEPKIEVKETAFSDEQENTKNTDGEKGEKFLTLINKDNQETIGNLFYDYPKEGNNNEILKVRFAGIEDKYKGQAFAIKMYEKLLEEAKAKNLDGIGSDAAVSSPAAVVWKKLMDKGYKVDVNPAIEEKWNRFLDTYNEGKMFKEMFSVSNKESAFQILFKEQGNRADLDTSVHY